MEVISVSYDVDAPAQKVWELISDFYDIEAWWPNTGPVKIERVVVEGGGIGGIRHIYNQGFEHAVSERLDEIDPDNHTWKLSIVCDRPVGLTFYQATGTLTKLDSKRCTLSYLGKFETEPGRENEAREFLTGCYEFMKGGLETVAQQRIKKESK